MADAVVYLDDENFKAEISQGKTLVDFYADWCGPCRMMEPLIHELATELKGKVKIAKVDIEGAQKVTSEFQVTSVPTLIVFEGGREIDRVVGMKDKEALKRLVGA